MYFIDRDKMEALLQFMETQFADLKGFSSWQSTIQIRALERMTQLIIESFLDVGNQLIDGFIMRDPGSYEDIVDILVDESVLPLEEKEAYLKLVQLRKQLVQQYEELSSDTLKEQLQAHLSTWSTFPKQVRGYVESELGPVSAFKPASK
ncbi:DUF86 domain-containing protein [Pullulanibacillus sp. KACC 23026]|uniref:DUF86 domain-containing protein n=1 Tax=Pullulanibacillus sp. KACC 23026 TaxID=3028315 RepID=UPI0023AF1D75|nr:DUF86 domain-containing protein [Pullulanibacillus sp. KACC 23026]WEG13776.1 DUF86 domain-containing protein [Pullulanibacillus sp. KACC 23026]